MTVGGIELLEGEFDLRLRPSEPESCRSLTGEIGVVALDLETTPELEAEGTARDVIRLVQRARRDAGLQVTDRIELVVVVAPEVATVLKQWRSHIAAQVLATEFEIEAYESTEEPTPKDEWFTAVGELSDRSVITIRLRRAG